MLRQGFQVRSEIHIDVIDIKFFTDVISVGISRVIPSVPSIHRTFSSQFSIISLSPLSPSKGLYHALVRLNIHKDRMVLIALKDRNDDYDFSALEAMIA